MLVCGPQEGRARQQLSMLKTTFLVLGLLECVGSSFGAIIYLFHLLFRVSDQRAALFTVFLAIPGGALQGTRRPGYDALLRSTIRCTAAVNHTMHCCSQGAAPLGPPHTVALWTLLRCRLWHFGGVAHLAHAMFCMTYIQLATTEAVG
jgi:hypothetical protein